MTAFTKQATAFFSAAALAGGLQATEITLPADAKNTIPFKVLSHKIDADGNTSMVIDARTLDDNKLAVAFDNVTKAAILMSGLDNKRSCPYVDLKRYKHTIDQVEAGKYNFQITAKVDPADAKKALENQCLIVDIPSVKKINWKIEPTTY